MISGGGTGGHIYPAIAVAHSLQSMLQGVEILFVGARGRMEMTKVPQAGFPIKGLWISGIQRRLSLSNLLFPLKVIASVWKSFRLLRSFRPDAVVGTGGYASGPLLYAAATKKIPTLIQEQNAYAGLTNKWLAGKVNKICVAEPGMEKYFPADKLILTGNPVRKNIVLEESRRQEAYNFFGFTPEKKTVLLIGGSLGARTLNECMIAGWRQLVEKDIQVIWQTGGYYFEEMKSRVNDLPAQVRMMDFLTEMQYAYAVADLVISRAGALSLAELKLVGKPAVLVPSPNVAEDHQTRNARALVEQVAAVLVKDNEAKERLIPMVLQLLEDEGRREQLSKGILRLARPDADKVIANEIINMIR